MYFAIFAGSTILLVSKTIETAKVDKFHYLSQLVELVQMVRLASIVAEDKMHKQLDRLNCTNVSV